MIPPMFRMPSTRPHPMRIQSMIPVPENARSSRLPWRRRFHRSICQNPDSRTQSLADGARSVGREIAVRFRTALTRGAHGDNRFRWQSGATVHLYGINRLSLARAKGYITLVEGNERRDARLLQDIDRIFLMVEPDAAGQKLCQAIGRSSLRQRVKCIFLPDGLKDPSALHLASPADFADRWRAALANARPLTDVLLSASQTINPGIAPLRTD
jgi:hypothetical protein